MLSHIICVTELSPVFRICPLEKWNECNHFPTRADCTMHFSFSVHFSLCKYIIRGKFQKIKNYLNLSESFSTCLVQKSKHLSFFPLECIIVHPRKKASTIYQSIVTICNRTPLHIQPIQYKHESFSFVLPFAPAIYPKYINLGGPRAFLNPSNRAILWN